jgi:PhnB protein
MTIKTTPHLNFRGQARDALQFYAAVFGAEPIIVTYADMGAPVAPEQASQVVWGQVMTAAGFSIMAYDVPPNLDWNPGTIPFFVSLRGDDPAELERHWASLADGATILQPLAPSAWAPLYGMLKDRFGITWVLDIAAAR